MSFVSISLLGGTALVALPIVLHLIMRRKPKLLEFPALRFIQKRHETNQRRLRLRHLLLLLLRAGAIALLALALARPSINFSGVVGSQEAPVAAALVFDTAPRMEYRHENQSRLEAAQRLGLWLLGQLPRGSDVAVLDTRPGTAVGPGGFEIDRLAAEKRIERLGTVANSQPLSRVVEEAVRRLGQSELKRKEIYLLTDLSRGAWPRDSAARLQKRLAELRDVRIYLIDVGVKRPTDYGLGQLRLSGQVLSNRSSLRIETALFGTGASGERTVELHLLDNRGKDQKRSQQSGTVAPGEPRRVDFRLGSLGIGTHQGFLRIVGQDGLACDDTRFFTVEVKPAWRILVAAPKPTDRYTLFLTQALAPTMFRKRGEARFDCDVVDLEELGQRPLDAYAAVCLLDPEPLKPAVWKRLGDFAGDGHGVAIFLGRNAQPVDSFNSPLAQQLLPGRLLLEARAPDGDVYLAPRDYQHPILSAFRGSAGAIPWNASPVFRYWQLGELAEGVGVVLPFTDSRPALLERPVGNGRVLTMTTPVSDGPQDKPWNLLPVTSQGDPSWVYLILVNQMMSYLVGSSDQQLNYLAGQTAVLSLDAKDQHDIYQVFAPGDLTFKLSADLKQHLLMVSSADQVGNYRVRAGGLLSGVDRGFSVNLAPEQTQLERITEEELGKIFGQFDYQLARTEGEIERDINTARVGRELFSALILLVAGVLATEHVMANRFYRQ